MANLAARGEKGAGKGEGAGEAKAGPVSIAFESVRGELTVSLFGPLSFFPRDPQGLWRSGEGSVAGCMLMAGFLGGG